MRIFPIRVAWQLSKLESFIEDCFFRCAELLTKEPLKVFSGKYEETLKMERTQADMVNEMAQELMNLAKYTSYAKVIQEKSGAQDVLKRKIRTLPIGDAQEVGVDEAEKHFTESVASSGMCRSRDEIEKEITARQEPWRRRGRTDTPRLRRAVKGERVSRRPAGRRVCRRRLSRQAQL